jgi:adenylate kinase family enzyme
MNRNLVLLMAGAFTCLSLFDTLPSRAQVTHKDSLATNIRFSTVQLKAFEGFYQSSQNKEMVVQIIVSDSALNAKLLWNNGETHLVPESQWGFVTKEGGDEGPIHLVFQRDSSGEINQLNVAGNGIWNRVKDYKPVVKKELEHTPAQLAPFRGLYQLREDNTRFIQFSVRENNLVLKQVWDGSEILFVPESELTFFSKEVPSFSLDFSKDKNGNITQALAFKRDVWIKKDKPALTPAILKSYEGKFRSQVDPDNEIRIIATDSNLIARQLWDKKDNVLQPLTDIYFNNRDRSFPLVIVKDPDGKVVQIVLLLGNVFNKVPE